MTEGERHHYYDLYELYQKLKGETRDYDSADLVSHIYSALEGGTYARIGLYSGIFVDEVQDLTMRQLSILRFVSSDLNGFCFAGDTAQTIAHGVGFRFESLKDIFFKEFIRGNSGYKVPAISQLKQNFRTHTGVLRVANTIIKLLTQLFPDTIDKLDDESSLISGRKPIFIEDTDDVISALFTAGQMNNTGFGADQVILVRDEDTKRALRDVSHNSCLILTVLEAKGMEFKDCLIYNFFTSGELGSMWRILGGLYERLGLTASGKPFTKFDPSLHACLNQELKMLYVLITRPKERLFFFESCVESRGPILSLWSHPELAVVELKKFDDDIRATLQGNSTPEEWIEQGKKMLTRKNYEEAKLAYSRGGDGKMERLCHALLQEQEGSKMEGKSQHDAKCLPLAYELYRNAAYTYENEPLQNIPEAAKLYRRCHDFAKAAALFKSVNWFKEAGECCRELHQWREAAEAFAEAHQTDEAIDMCRSGKLFHLAITILDRAASHDSDSDSIPVSEYANLRKEMVRLGADYCHKKHQFDSDTGMMFFVHKMDTSEAKIKFLNNRKDCTGFVLDILVAGMSSMYVDTAVHPLTVLILND